MSIHRQEGIACDADLRTRGLGPRARRK